MPSKQSQAVKRHWTAARLAMVQPDAEQPDDESCGDLTAEPHDMDYIEIDAGGLPAMWAAPKRRAEDRVLLCMHGGGFINGSIYSHRKLFGHLAKATGARALLFDYHLAPGHTHPTQVNEATAVYRWLLDQGVSADHIAFTGDSSGGGLSITTQLRARERGPAPPGRGDAVLAVGGYGGHREVVRNQPGPGALLLQGIRAPVRGHLPGRGRRPRDPLANPLYADLSGLGPIYIQVGGNETLLDDARRLAEYARRAGVDVRLDVFPDMLHTFQMAAGRAPEADEAIRRMADWVRPRLGLSITPSRTGVAV
jgi:epsilon-lactone hydrolase